MSNLPENTDLRRDLVQAVVPIARNLVERSLGGASVSPQLHAQIRSLVSGMPTSHRVTTVVGALVSAILDLDRDLSRGKVSPTASDDDLAVELVRLAYNRWQRERRAADRLLAQAAVGEHHQPTQGQQSGGRWLEQIRSPDNSPETAAHFRGLFDQLIERLTPQDVEILLLFAEGYTTAEIAQRHGCHRTTISRKLDRISDMVQRITKNDESKQ